MYRLLVLCLLLPLLAPAQTQPDCDQMLRDGDALMARRDPPLEEALRCYLNALNCNSQLAGVVGPKVQGVFEAIKKQKEREHLATRQAKEEATNARRAQEKAEQAARTNYANDLVYKSQAALQDGDRTTAFRLAEFAYRYADAGNPKVLQALIDALYYNDNPVHAPLPWAWNLEGCTDSVQSAAFSPDGKRLATWALDNTTKIWDLASGKAIRAFPVAGTNGIDDMAFSPDGKRLATQS
ncbi:MAG: hypothetical protein ABIQ93_04710, partial [Saprospiraceae bacterium]